LGSAYDIYPNTLTICGYEKQGMNLYGTGLKDVILSSTTQGGEVLPLS